YCDTDRGETFGARYTVNHAAGSNNVTLNHETHIGLWMTLGEFDLATSSGSLYLSDLTTTDNGRGVWFDGVRLLLVGDADIPTTVANTAPTPDLWLTNSAVDFTWDIEGPNTILQTMLQVATDAQMSNLIVNQTWASSVEQYTHTFTQDYADLFWQVTAVAQKEDGSSETSVSQVTQFSLDATAPTSTITTVFHVPNQVYYNVAWSGSDNLSGISSYNIQIRAAGDTNWTTWLLNTIQTSAVLYPPDGRVYELRSQATDAAGNIEPEHANADGRTDQAIQLSNGIMLPIIRR
ncbi:MAG: hypothetical protein GY796_02515, partial [Chloroflexi bacterium]|nr:hypothetical protein [Chloroflexota bacterium]